MSLASAIDSADFIEDVRLLIDEPSYMVTVELVDLEHEAFFGFLVGNVIVGVIRGDQP